MVTFVCHHCDSTLKKNQLEKHSFQCRRPCAFICIDCSKTFQGNEYKEHISCMTEEQKYFGQYAKPLKTKQAYVPGQQPNGKTQNNNTNGNPQNGNEIAPPSIIEKTPLVQEAEVKEEVEETESKWKGWKSTIKKIVKSKPSKQIKLKKVRELACKLYKESHPEEKEKSIFKLFDEKIASFSKVQIINEPYVAFNEE